jgi:hypothetical protein
LLHWYPAGGGGQYGGQHAGGERGKGGRHPASEEPGATKQGSGRRGIFLFAFFCSLLFLFSFSAFFGLFKIQKKERKKKHGRLGAARRF